MKSRIGRRELLGAGMGLCASLAASSALGQSSETAPRESGTDALGRRVGAAPRRKEIPKRMAIVSIHREVERLVAELRATTSRGRGAPSPILNSG